MNRTHDDLRALLAAYALGAVDDAEADAVRQHLESCRECQQEFADHLETVVAMDTGDAPASDELWRRVATSLSPPEAAPKPATVPSRPTLFTFLAVAAVVVAVGAVGFGIGRIADTTGDVVAQAAAEARAAEGALDVELVADSAVSAQAVLLPDGTGYIYDHELPALSADRTYQLWAVTEGGVISAGVFGSDPGVVSFHAAGDVAALVLTEEPAGGVVVSEGALVAAWERG